MCVCVCTALLEICFVCCEATWPFNKDEQGSHDSYSTLYLHLHMVMSYPLNDCMLQHPWRAATPATFEQYTTNKQIHRWMNAKINGMACILTF